MYVIPTTDPTPQRVDFGYRPETNPLYTYMDDKLENVLLFEYGAKRGAVLGTGAMGGVCKLEVAYPNNAVHAAKFDKLREYLRTSRPVIKYADDHEEAALSELLYRRYKDAQSKKPFSRPPPVGMPTIGRVFKVETPNKTMYAIIREDIEDHEQLEPHFRRLWRQYLMKMHPDALEGQSLVTADEADIYTRRLLSGGDVLSAELIELKAFFQKSARATSNKTERVEETVARLDAVKLWLKTYNVAQLYVRGLADESELGTEIGNYIRRVVETWGDLEKKGQLKPRNHKRVLIVAFKMMMRLFADMADLWLWLSTERIRITDMHSKNYGVVVTPTSKGERLRLVYRDIGMADDEIKYQDRLEPQPADDASFLMGLRSGARRGRVRRR